VLPRDAYQITLEGFEGPLDLLLHLIQQHELDILDIPISFITQKYLEYLEMMRSLEIDVASSYLVMAAQLALIKSKMLLPQPEQGDEEGEEELEDPRAELVRRLLEYQKYKHAAQQLGGRAVLDRDVFERGTAEPQPPGPAPLAAVSAYKLFEAFDQVLKRAHRVADHQVLLERVSIAERMVAITELLQAKGSLRFEQLFELPDDEGGTSASVFDMVVTLLALLEMCRLGLAWVVQDDPLGPLRVESAAGQGGRPVPGAGLRKTRPEVRGARSARISSPASVNAQPSRADRSDARGPRNRRRRRGARPAGEQHPRDRGARSRRRSHGLREARAPARRGGRRARGRGCGRPRAKGPPRRKR